MDRLKGERMLRSRGCRPPKLQFCERVTEMRLPLSNCPGDGQRQIINGEYPNLGLVYRGQGVCLAADDNGISPSGAHAGLPVSRFSTQGLPLHQLFGAQVHGVEGNCLVLRLPVRPLTPHTHIQVCPHPAQGLSPCTEAVHRRWWAAQPPELAQFRDVLQCSRGSSRDKAGRSTVKEGKMLKFCSNTDIFSWTK